jgi:hypothetical protein
MHYANLRTAALQTTLSVPSLHGDDGDSFLCLLHKTPSPRLVALPYPALTAGFGQRVIGAVPCNELDTFFHEYIMLVLPCAPPHIC